MARLHGAQRSAARVRAAAMRYQRCLRARLCSCASCAASCFAAMQLPMLVSYVAASKKKASCHV